MRLTKSEEHSKDNLIMVIYMLLTY